MSLAGPTTTPAPTSGSRLRRLRGRARVALAALFATQPGRPIGWPAITLACAAVLLGTALSLLRQPGAGALDTIWAEDGRIFLSEAVGHGPQAFVTSYAGYYHAIPRLLAALAALVPADAAAAVLAVAAALCAALGALLVYVASGSQLTSPLTRLLVSAVVLAVPVGSEVWNSIANLHWYGLYALFWVLIWTPRGRAARFVAVAVVLLVAGSDILALVFVPLALLRALRRVDGGRREPHGRLLATALGLGLAAQFAGLLVGASSRALSPDLVQAVVGYLLRAVPAPLIGERWLGNDVGPRLLALAAVAWVVVATVVLLARTRLVRPAWPLAACAAAHSAALYILPVLLSGTATPRYAVAPAMLVVVALVALLQPRPDAAARPAAAGVPLLAMTALLAFVAVVNFRPDNPRADGPRWRGEVDRARAGCAAAPEGTAELPIPPAGEQSWKAVLPCTYLLGR